MRGRCLGCGEMVEVDCPPDGHTRAEHDCRGDERECYRRCPIPVLCGPIQPAPEGSAAEGGDR